MTARVTNGYPPAADVPKLDRIGADTPRGNGKEVGAPSLQPMSREPSRGWQVASDDGKRPGHHVGPHGV